MNLRTVPSSPHWLTLALEGSLDHAGVTEVEPAFLAAVTAQSRSVVVDLSEVSFIASLGMRMFLNAHKHLASSGHSLTLFRPTPTTRKILRHAGMESVFSLAETEGELSTLMLPLRQEE